MLLSSNDQILIERLKRRDRKAFEEMFDLYYTSLHAYAKQFVYDSLTADDIVQEIFLKLWDNSFELEISTSLKGYLFTMVRNKSLNLLRSLKISNDLKIAVTEQQSALFTNAPQEMDSFNTQVTNLINSLPDKSKIIFKKRILEGYKFKEIAALLGISEANCKMTLKRSIEKIKKENPNLKAELLIALSVVLLDV